MEEDLIDLTKDYFNKTKEEQEELLTQFENEISVIMEENEIKLSTVINHFDKLIETSRDNEDYEVTEVITKMKKRFIEKHQ